MTTCITTFSKDGYDLYGHRMIESWIEHWPASYKLLVYTEDFDVVESDPRISIININDTVLNLIKFKSDSQTLLDNATDRKTVSRIQKTVKWSHKVFVISHALNTISDDYFIFLDGDTYTVDTIEPDTAEKLIEHYLLAVHFENLVNLGLHFETGLVVFKSDHTQMDLFKTLYISGYEDLSIYNLSKAWDGFWLAELYKTHNLDVKNLSKHNRGVFSNPIIANKLIHDVGTKKYLQAGYNKFTGKKQ